MRVIYFLVTILCAKGFVTPVAKESRRTTPTLEADSSPFRRGQVQAQDRVDAKPALNGLALLGGRVLKPRFQHHKHPWPTDYDVLENEDQSDRVPVDVTATAMDQVIDIKQSIEEIVQAAINLTNGTMLPVTANLTLTCNNRSLAVRVGSQ